MPDTTTPYRGRFAPSPTGPLHLGSLIAALASYLDARRAGGRWLVRMEDLDPPREAPGAAQRILHSLRRHGLAWDEDVLWQGERAAAYQGARQRLAAGGLLFHCDCTRTALGPDGSCAGRCRPRQDEVRPPFAVRVSVPAHCQVEFHDQLQGPQHSALGLEFPDFVVKRKDGLDAYQLAVVVDDDAQGITHVVRGSDLLDSTPRQIYLQQVLELATPHYCHLPVITNRAGQKFSKQNHAPAVDDEKPLLNLRQALQFLHQPPPPPGLADTRSLLAFAVEHWQPGLVPHRQAIPAGSIGL